MKLVRVKVQNLRCVDSLEVFPKAYTSLIGPNNAGKSTVLRAIEILLNQETPALDEWRKPWKYLLIPHDEIAENMTLPGLTSRFAVSS
jgi:predicted ATP-dependent endonuclease of OLD family